MPGEVKLRLYVSIIVVAMLILYVAPIMVASHWTSVQEMIFSKCQIELEFSSFDLCWARRNEASLPFWEYLIPYLPAAALLWFNWIFKPNFQLTADSYPKRTIGVLLWLGLIVAACGTLFPIWTVATTDINEIHKISVTNFLAPLRILAGWLIAPLLFHHLVAPVSLAANMKKGKVALLLLAAAPIVAGIMFLMREVIRLM